MKGKMVWAHNQSADTAQVGARAPHQDADSRFVDAVNALAGIDRAVVAMTDLAGLSARAVAEALGIGKAQAHIVLMQARRTVRQHLLEDGHVEHALVTARA